LLVLLVLSYPVLRIKNCERTLSYLPPQAK